LADGLIIAAPQSGSGKTVVTLGLLRALRQRGIATASAKIGPDYIDPRFHERASGRPCYNLDAWAMPPALLAGLLNRSNAATLIVEGVMGLFDGPEAGRGSTADIAEGLSLPVVLVIDASRQSQSLAALVHGFATYRPALAIAGVICNRVAGPRHAAMLTAALQPLRIPILGMIGRDAALSLPSRHLGLVPAGETPELEGFLDKAAAIMAQSLDIEAILAACRPVPSAPTTPGLPPLGQRIAVASDDAFAFAYPHLLAGWRDAGAEIHPFTPLADEPPPPGCDAIFLPGGYPELQAGRLAAANRFLGGLRRSNALVYGECGGFMVLGRHLIDADGNTHEMAGLLPLVTSFAKRELHLGYRELDHAGALPFPPRLRGHEFHYSTIARQDAADPLFQARDAAGRDLGPIGLRHGHVMGSYAHVIA
jgi:cobyrinic acid a,c-diamide synthase